MRQDKLMIDGFKIKVISLNTVVVGSGAAGLNAADRLYSLGQKDIAIVTEGLKKGTSLNTGSDKQTYYKLTLSGEQRDSIDEMAKTLFNGGCMDGDIAVVEAALSPRCFLHLVEVGVPFPHNRYGEYSGYKTDFDPRQRATSVGPLTSKIMTEKLFEQVINKGINIYDKHQVIKIMTDEEKTRIIGCMVLDLSKLENPKQCLVIFNCQNIVFAVGGPAGIYESSVYPESQNGAIGIALEAGAIGKNLTESQYGIASIKFRWNLSGSYQQVLPRYISTDQHGGDEVEFLDAYFSSTGKMLDAIFSKGYQWPFDPQKIENDCSSLIDLLIYNETVVKGRRVWLDYKHNPGKSETKNGELDFKLLMEESYQYLKNSGAIAEKPIDRLKLMNQPAIDLFLQHGIDLEEEYLEIAVCAQHNNGGLHGNIWWESNLEHFFPVGEVNGSHGIHRPGGSALNAGQVGSLRAAQFIALRYSEKPPEITDFISGTKKQIMHQLEIIQNILENFDQESNITNLREHARKIMSQYGANIRSLEGIKKAINEIKKNLNVFPQNLKINSLKQLSAALQVHDMLISQFVYLSAIRNYLEKGGQSRGSYLIYNPDGELPASDLPEMFRYQLDQKELSDKIQRVRYHAGECIFYWDQVKNIPSREDWFENIWRKYREDRIIQKKSN